MAVSNHYEQQQKRNVCPMYENEMALLLRLLVAAARMHTQRRPEHRQQLVGVATTMQADPLPADHLDQSACTVTSARQFFCRLILPFERPSNYRPQMARNQVPNVAKHLNK